MWRWARRFLAGIVGLLVIAAVTGAFYQAWVTSRTLSAYPPPGRLVDVGGHRLHIWCTGAGVPTVLLDSGRGGVAFDWSHVQPVVAAFTHVCSYDRAGMGYSDPGPRPRTSRQIVRELAALLDRGGVPGRVILVGASIGGWNVRLFASTHSERAAGLVLVDARHENQGEELAAAGAPEHPPPVAYVAPLVAYVGIARLLGIAPGLRPDSFAPECSTVRTADAISLQCPGDSRERVAEWQRQRGTGQSREARVGHSCSGSFSWTARHARGRGAFRSATGSTWVVEAIVSGHRRTIWSRDRDSTAGNGGRRDSRNCRSRPGRCWSSRLQLDYSAVFTAAMTPVVRSLTLDLLIF